MYINHLGGLGKAQIQEALAVDKHHPLDTEQGEEAIKDRHPATLTIQSLLST
jgi:hypothetical protein